MHLIPTGTTPFKVLEQLKSQFICQSAKQSTRKVVILLLIACWLKKSQWSLEIQTVCNS